MNLIDYHDPVAQVKEQDIKTMYKIPEISDSEECNERSSSELSDNEQIVLDNNLSDVNNLLLSISNERAIRDYAVEIPDEISEESYYPTSDEIEEEQQQSWSFKNWLGF